MKYRPWVYDTPGAQGGKKLSILMKIAYNGHLIAWIDKNMTFLK